MNFLLIIIKKYLPYLVSLGLVLYIFSFLDIKNFKLIDNYNYLYLIIILWIVGQLLVSLRIYLLVQNKLNQVSYFSILQCIFLGYSINIIAPGESGTDISLFLYLKKFFKYIDILSMLLLDRIIITFSTILFVFIGIQFFDLSQIFDIDYKYITIFILFILFIFSCLYLIILRSKNLIQKFIDYYKEIKKFFIEKYKLLVPIFLIGMINRLVYILWVYFIAKSIGLEFNIMYLFVIVPMVLIISTLPISIMGIGIREGSYVGLLVLGGYSLNDSVLFSTILLFWMLIPSILSSVLVFSGIIKVKNLFN